MILKKILIFFEMIKFPHTIFALPFALASAFIAANGLPSAPTLFWIIAAMVGARTGAMAFNRFVDSKIDSKNPRTQDRALPQGLLRTAEVVLYTVISFGLLIYSAYKLNMICFYLSFVAISILILYSYTKRFTSCSHVVLGLCLAGAPAGAWIAVTGGLSLSAVLLSAAVLLWVAGFDILYALQDLKFDREHGLHSIPVRWGIGHSIIIARSFHVGMLLLLSSVFLLGVAGFIYLLGIALITALLLYEHSLIRNDDLSKLNIAFFNMNGYISVIYFIFVVVDIYWRKQYGQ